MGTVNSLGSGATGTFGGQVGVRGGEAKGTSQAQKGGQLAEGVGGS